MLHDIALYKFNIHIHIHSALCTAHCLCISSTMMMMN